MPTRNAASGTSPVHPNEAVKAFFNKMPTPEEHFTKSLKDIEHELASASIEFLLTPVAPAGARDPAYNFISKASKDAMNNAKEGAVIYEYLAVLAVSTRDNPADNSPLARQLRYLRWVATGMKDGVSPFPWTATSTAADTVTDNCASCGKSGVTNACAGCRLPSDDGKPFATIYCDKKCQQNDWANHKSLCLGIKSLNRAVGIFDDVFKHLLSITYQGEYKITNLAVEQKLLVAKAEGEATRQTIQHNVSTGPDLITNYSEVVRTININSQVARSSEDDPSRKWCKFPTDVSFNPDHAMAVLMHTECQAPSIDARALLEMLIRPATIRLEKILFVPKNMTLPVLLVHKDFIDLNALMPHEVFRATLKNGSKQVQFAVDPTAMQFGWTKTLVPWEHYVRKRVHRIEKVDILPPQLPGHALIEQDRLPSAKKPTSRAIVIASVAQMVSKALHKRGTSINAVLRLKPQYFDTCRIAIVDSIKRGTDRLVEEKKRGATLAPVQMDPGQFGASTAVAAKYLSLDILWFTKQDLAASGGNMLSETVRNTIRRRWEELLELGPLPGIDTEKA